MKPLLYLYKNDDNYYKAKSIEEIKEFYKNKKLEPWERFLNPSYYEVYEFENGYTPKEVSMNFEINPFILNPHKKYAIFKKNLEIEDYEDPIEKLDKYIEENGKKIDRYLQYDYDCGFYVVDGIVYSDRTGKYVTVDKVKEILEEIK